jgi:lipopolysaccharide cholinephosphotransferase
MEDLSHYNPEGSVMRRAQMRMLEILRIFHGICERHNINYWLDWGTLLGAYRHAGFIPWDDDLDVTILWKDRKKLISALEKELPDDLKLQTRKTDKKYYKFHPKIRDTKSRLHNKRSDVYEFNGIFFDIFYLEPMPSIEFKRIIDNFLLAEINFVRAKTLYRKVKYGLISCFIPLVWVLIGAVRFYYRYIGKTTLYAYTFGGNTYAKYNYDNFFPLTEITFEGGSFKAPNKIDAYLKDQFGSTYMNIPDEADRYSHAINIEFF